MRFTSYFQKQLNLNRSVIDASFSVDEATLNTEAKQKS